MPVLPIDPESLSLPADAARAMAKQHGEVYRGASPYPHGCIDGFLDARILDRVRDELKLLPEAETSFDRPQERLKFSFAPERLQPYTRNLFYALNSRPFVMFLEELTGIDGLIPDPYFAGGGIHMVANGGHLDIHADFDHHGKLNLERRLNVLIYLNKDWKEEYGGSFEIWNKEMTARAKSFVPIFNRMVCFSTGADTWHGNPTPVSHPDGQPRMSMALYYYTATWTAARKAHTTQFKPRPGTADQRDKQVARQELIRDVLPPVVYRRVAGPLSRIGL